MIRSQADKWVASDAENLFGSVFGDLFDFHSAFGAGHHHGGTNIAVDHDRQVKLVFDVEGFRDHYFFDRHT